MSAALLESLVVIAAAVCAIAYCITPSRALQVATVVLSIFAIIVGVALGMHAGL